MSAQESANARPFRLRVLNAEFFQDLRQFKRLWQGRTPTVLVGQLWRAMVEGNLLLLVEQGPLSRTTEDLHDDW